MSAPAIFVSHSHKDDKYCHAFVAALRRAGLDVWYDEHDASAGHLIDVISHQIRLRPIFILILSPAALASDWVKDECVWAYGRWQKDKANRVILPVLVETVNEDDIWDFIQVFRRIEQPELHPWPVAEAARRAALAIDPNAPMIPASSQLTPPPPQNLSETTPAAASPMNTDRNRKQPPQVADQLRSALNRVRKPTGVTHTPRILSRPIILTLLIAIAISSLGYFAVRDNISFWPIFGWPQTSTCKLAIDGYHVIDTSSCYLPTHYSTNFVVHTTAVTPNQRSDFGISVVMNGGSDTYSFTIDRSGMVDIYFDGGLSDSSQQRSVRLGSNASNNLALVYRDQELSFAVNGITADHPVRLYYVSNLVVGVTSLITADISSDSNSSSSYPVFTYFSVSQS